MATRKKQRIQKVNEATAWAFVEITFRSRTGICAMIDSLARDGLISMEVADAMAYRIAAQRAKGKGSTPAYLWPMIGADIDLNRTDFAAGMVRRLARRS